MKGSDHFIGYLHIMLLIYCIYMTSKLSLVLHKLGIFVINITNIYIGHPRLGSNGFLDLG